MTKRVSHFGLRLVAFHMSSDSRFWGKNFSDLIAHVDPGSKIVPHHHEQHWSFPRTGRLQEASNPTLTELYEIMSRLQICMERSLKVGAIIYRSL